MARVEKYSANLQDLAQRVLLSQERLRAGEFGEKNVRVLKVWSACIALTAGWGKCTDTVHVKVIEEQAGLPKGKASAVLYELHDAGVIQWSKDRGMRSMGILSLPELVPTSPECPSCGAIGMVVNGICGGCGAKQ